MVNKRRTVKCNGGVGLVYILGISKIFKRIVNNFAEYLTLYKVYGSIYGVGYCGHGKRCAACKTFVFDVCDVKSFAVFIVFRIVVESRVGDFVKISFALAALDNYVAYAAYSAVGNFNYYPAGYRAAEAACTRSVNKVVAVVFYFVSRIY